MLVNLKIENVAVIEYAEILFDEGLNILTGETGAGKSIVIDSINAILGERTSKDIVRDSADHAKVTAFFENVSKNVIDKLAEFEIDYEDDGSLLIARTINSDGRSQARINGQPVTASMLKNIGRDLITICGQHDSQYLLVKERHIDFVNALADCDELLEDYRETYKKVKSLKKQLKATLENESDKERKLEFLKYQIDELKSAGITPGEREALQDEKKKIKNRENIMQQLNSATAILNGDGENSGAVSMLFSLGDILTELSRYDESFAHYLDGINDVKYLLEDCSREISGSLSEYDEGYTDIDSVEERLDTLYRLSKKYGQTEEDMLDCLSRLTEEYDSIVFSSEQAEILEAELSKEQDELFKKGCYLSDCRKKTAVEFEKGVMAELKFLDMPDAVFSVDFKDIEPTDSGIDDVEFLFSANKGQEPKPLSKIASGGELSRVMLAIRCVLADFDKIDTMIFDEIDMGVSGRAAHKIAYKLSELSKTKQVLCVTHLAQIAAYADHHLMVEKTTDESSTYTKVTSLDRESRIHEIARIMGGDNITEKTLDSARELLDFNKKS